MGDILSKPVTEKESTDEFNDRFICGASSMQGWRQNQEDAHNIILDFDIDTSFFAVYDGHSGAEVADYCSKKLPDFIRNTQEYKEDKIEDALISGFLGFDALIKTPEVVEVLTSKALEVKMMAVMRKKEKKRKGKEKKAEEEEAKKKDLEKTIEKESQVNENTTSSLEGPVVNGDEQFINEQKNIEKGSQVNENTASSLEGAVVNADEQFISEQKTQVSGSDNPLEIENSKSNIDVNIQNEENSIPSVRSDIINKAGTSSTDEKKLTVVSRDDDDESVTFDNSDNEELDLFLRKHRCGWDSGCTAIVALLKGNKLYVANVGDSRCFVCRNGKAIDMSIDHKPLDVHERQRIEKAGGYVKNGRVHGNLNMSRAIGDHKYKQNIELSEREQKMTALPDIRTLEINPNEDEFMVLECDGISNSMSNQEVVDFVRPKINDGRTKLSTICEELFDKLLPLRRSLKGMDNMTAIIIKFKSNVKRSVSADSEVNQAETKSRKTSQT